MRNVFLFLLIIAGGSCRTHSQDMKTAEAIDLGKYSGLWYDYAHLPARFLDGCSDITATYKIENEKYVSVYNSCIKTRDGRKSDIKGKAFLVPGSNNSKLRVQFFWPFRADYWILDIDEDYSYALVGGPSRKYLWILSRSPQMDTGVYDRLIEKSRELGFPVENMVKTLHR